MTGAWITLKLSNRTLKQLCSEQEEATEPMDHQEETVMIGVKTIKQKEQEKCTTVRRKSCSDYCKKGANNTVSALIWNLNMFRGGYIQITEAVVHI